MAKQIKTLTNPIAKGDGVSITKLEVNYVYFHAGSVHVFFKQGVDVIVANNAAISKALKDIEDAAMGAIDVPPVP